MRSRPQRLFARSRSALRSLEAMATKAERYRYEAQRSGAPKKKTTKTKKHAAAPPESARPRKAMVALGETPPKIPPARKAPGRAMPRQKGATSLTAGNLLAKGSPRTRHDIGPPTLRAPR